MINGNVSQLVRLRNEEEEEEEEKFINHNNAIYTS